MPFGDGLFMAAPLIDPDHHDGALLPKQQNLSLKLDIKWVMVNNGDGRRGIDDMDTVVLDVSLMMPRHLWHFILWYCALAQLDAREFVYGLLMSSLERLFKERGGGRGLRKS